MKKLLPFLILLLIFSLTLPCYGEELARQPHLRSQNISENEIVILQNPEFYDSSISPPLNISGHPMIRFYKTDEESLSSMPLPKLLDHCERATEYSDYLVNTYILRITPRTESEPSAVVSNVKNNFFYDISQYISQKHLPLRYGERIYQEENILDLYAFYTEDTDCFFVYYVTPDGTFISVRNRGSDPIVLTQEDFLTLMQGFVRFLDETNAIFYFSYYIKTVQSLSLDIDTPQVPTHIYTYRIPYIILSAVSGLALGVGSAFCVLHIRKRKKGKQ